MLQYRVTITGNLSTKVVTASVNDIFLLDNKSLQQILTSDNEQPGEYYTSITFACVTSILYFLP